MEKFMVPEDIFVRINGEVGLYQAKRVEESTPDGPLRDGILILDIEVQRVEESA